MNAIGRASRAAQDAYMVRRQLALAALVALLVCGCSLLRTSPPERPTPGRWTDCDDSRIAPTIDTSIAVLFALGTLFIVNAVAGLPTCNEPECHDEGIPATPVLAIGGAFTASFALAAGKGFRDTDKCRRIHAEESWFLSWEDPGAGHYGRYCRPPDGTCDEGLICEDHVCSAP